MRYVFIVLMCLMFLFAGVQFNDPDGTMWIVIYSIPAIWCALAAFWPIGFHHIQTKILLVISIVAALAGVLWFWPLTPKFWTKEVWYNVETAREGLGLMIVASVLLIVMFNFRRKVRHSSNS